MANYSSLKSDIQNVIKQNGNNEITGNILQQSLLAMITSLGSGYLFRGVAGLSTNPGTPDQNVFYLASQIGIYSNFSNIEITNADGLCALIWNGAWSKQSTGAATKVDKEILEQQIELLNEQINGQTAYIQQSLIANSYFNTNNNPLSETPGSGTGTYCAKIAVTPGETYKITGVGSGNKYGKLWVTANSSRYQQRAADITYNGRITPAIVTIQENEAYLYVNLGSYDSLTDKVEKVIRTGGIEPRIEALEEQVPALEEKTDVLEDALTQTTETAMAVTYESGYINSSGTVTSSNYAEHSDFLRIDANYYTIYTTYGSGWRCAFYSSNNEASFLSAVPLGEGESNVPVVCRIVPPQNAVYMRITASAQVTDKKFTAYRESLVDFGRVVLPKEYYVKPDGSGDFTGLVEALTALRDDESPKRIHVEGGIYDILEEMGGQTFINSIPSDVPASAWPTYSNFVPNNTAIIGDGEVTLNFFPPDDTPQEKMAVISPMAFRGSVTLENITINASNCRYAIHDEAGEVSTGMTKIYRNVKCHKTGGGYTQCFAGGLSSHSTLIFDNCLFESSNGIAWYIHENTVGYGSILFSNCAFLPGGGGAALYLKTDRATGKESVQINNCVVNGNISLKDSAQRTNRYDLLLIKSGTPTITCDSGANPFTPQIIN